MEHPKVQFASTDANEVVNIGRHHDIDDCFTKLPWQYSTHVETELSGHDFHIVDVSPDDL